MKKFTLDSIVREFLIEAGAESASDKRYPRLLQIAISGLRQINQEKQTWIKTIECDVTDNDLIYLPDDYLDYRQVAVCIGGKMIGLGLNQNLCNPATNDCGTLKSPNLSTGTDNIFYDPGSYSGSGMYTSPNAFGKGGGDNGIGYFKPFPQKGYISVSLTGYSLGGQTPNIIMEYEADIQMSEFTGEYQVNPYDVEALKAWIEWGSKRGLSSTSTADKEYYKREYIKQLNS